MSPVLSSSDCLGSLGLGLRSSLGLSRAPTGALRGVQHLGRDLRAVVVELELGVGEYGQIRSADRSPLALVQEIEYDRVGLGVVGNTHDLHIVVVLDDPIGGEAAGLVADQQRLVVGTTDLLLLTAKLAEDELIAGPLRCQSKLVPALKEAEAEDCVVLAERKRDGIHLDRKKESTESTEESFGAWGVGCSATAYLCSTPLTLEACNPFNFFRTVLRSDGRARTEPQIRIGYAYFKYD